ncbi:hypothetical protein [Corynebacterium sp. AOP12-C2-36]|uniref:hypothetical protein n=1 Tax=Corynebacterium sp. AOP12-C2-36 TaxID=3457723 RepID=UPI004034961C
MTAPSAFNGFGATTATADTNTQVQNYQPAPEQQAPQNPQANFGGQAATQNPPQGTPQLGGFGGQVQQGNPQGGFGGNLNTAAGQSHPAAGGQDQGQVVKAHADAAGFDDADTGGHYIKLKDLADQSNSKAGGVVALRPISYGEMIDTKFGRKEKARFDLVILTAGPSGEMSQYAGQFLANQSDLGGFVVGAVTRAIDSGQKWILRRLEYIPTNKGNPGLALQADLSAEESKALGQLVVAHGKETPEFFGLTEDDMATVSQMKAQLGLA